MEDNRDLSVNGLVLKETQLNENDKIISVLTDDLGLISIFARGIKNMKNKNYAGALQFCYSNFEIMLKGKSYILKTARPLKYFIDISNDIEGLSLAAYFAEVLNEILPIESVEEDALSLILNSLYALTIKDFKPSWLIKAAFEIKLCQILGYCPELLTCGNCGEQEEKDVFDFSLTESFLVCSACIEKIKDEDLQIRKLHRYIVCALRYIVNSPIKRYLLFKLNDEYKNEFLSFCEEYFLYFAQIDFKTLKYYKQTVIDNEKG